MQVEGMINLDQSKHLSTHVQNQTQYSSTLDC